MQSPGLVVKWGDKPRLIPHSRISLLMHCRSWRGGKRIEVSLTLTDRYCTECTRTVRVNKTMVESIRTMVHDMHPNKFIKNKIFILIAFVSEFFNNGKFTFLD